MVEVLGAAIPTTATADQETRRMLAIQTTRRCQLLPVLSRAIGVLQCGQSRMVEVLAVAIPWQKEKPEVLGKKHASLESRS